MKSDIMRENIILWINAAEEDLFDADLALKNRRWFRAAFYAQQAVEKVLKALYFVVARQPPPYTRRVTVLYKGLRDKGFMLSKELEEQLSILNKYYTITRYPDAANGLPSEAVDGKEAKRAVNIAKRVIEAVKNEIYKHT
ncbi:MAG: HEPN domain-containing protein [Desulfurococcales archaeon]|nr:HEPN domain-containing protein [Desulfurococcales archaeon]